MDARGMRSNPNPPFRNPRTVRVGSVQLQVTGPATGTLDGAVGGRIGHYAIGYGLMASHAPVIDALTCA